MTQQDADFKRAAIDWLLANGSCDSMHDSTGLALADLAVRGVDYDRSEAPEFRSVAIEPGDSFHEATFAQAFSATIYPLGADPDNWYDRHEFFINDEDLKTLLIGSIIRGVIAAGASGEATWKGRANTQEIARIEQRLAAEKAYRERSQ